MTRAEIIEYLYDNNVLTDGEYNHIMDKLNKHWGIGERKDE